MSENDTSTWRQRRFIAALLVCPTIREAAAQAGIGESTAWAYMRQPAVQQELARYQDATLSTASLRLADAMQLAIDTFEGVMKNSTASDAAKVSAARAVLDGGLRVAELVVLAQRIARLESMEDEDEDFTEGFVAAIG